MCSEGLVQGKNLLRVPSWPPRTHNKHGPWAVISETVGVFAALSSAVFPYRDNIQSPASSWPLTSADKGGSSAYQRRVGWSKKPQSLKRPVLVCLKALRPLQKKKPLHKWFKREAVSCSSIHCIRRLQGWLSFHYICRQMNLPMGLPLRSHCTITPPSPTLLFPPSQATHTSSAHPSSLPSLFQTT